MSAASSTTGGSSGGGSDATPTAAAGVVSGGGGGGRRKSRRMTGANPYDPFFSADAKLVGSSSLISSHNTIEPTDKVFIRPPPMPSVHTDGRGEVWNLKVGSYHVDAETYSRRINLSHTKKDVMRHGDFHPNTQCAFIFSGKVEVWAPGSEGDTEKKVYGPKDYIEVPPYVPHIYNYLEDTIMAEWWEDISTGEGAHFKHWFYAPYRRMVDVSFVKTTAGEKGKLRVFREVGREDVLDRDLLSGDSGIPKKTNWVSLLGAAAAVGAIGFVAGVSVAAKKS
mmetsp:Transcript_10405/g.22609  ORF Transcript_10405/g.22609 Transcript_10405/m.22609 type:complete len:280 (-) Transcript_10405:228-1067(-)